MASCCFVWKYASKNAGLQGSTLSGHHMTTQWPAQLFCTLGKVHVGHLQKLEVFSEDLPRAVFWCNCGTKWP